MPLTWYWLDPCGKTNYLLIKNSCNKMKNADAHTLYNLDYLNEISEGDTEFINEVALLFISEIPNKLDSIIQHAQNERWGEATAEIHRITPNFFLFGLNDIIDKLNKMESKLRSGSRGRDIINELKDVKNEFGLIVIQLKRDYNIS